MPKLHRRLDLGREPMVEDGERRLLAFLGKKPDELHLIADFLQQRPAAAAVHLLT